MNLFFLDLAQRFEAAGITAEAVEDAEGRPCARRFYVGGKAFEVRPELVEGERLRIAIDAYEAEETETPEEPVGACAGGDSGAIALASPSRSLVMGRRAKDYQYPALPAHDTLAPARFWVNPYINSLLDPIPTAYASIAVEPNR